jgi:hypothetical protein
VDYDGTILHSYTAAQFATLTAHPANPTHTGLTAQGWNWTLSDAKTHVATYGQLVIGQNYITTSGKTEFDIEVTEANRFNGIIWLLYFRLYKYATVNWGDGTSDQNVTGGSSNPAYVTVQHIYAQTGSYTITIEPDHETGSYFCFGAGSVSGPNILRTINDNRLVTLSIKHIRIGKNFHVDNNFYTFCNLGNLETVTIPSTLNNNTSRLFYNCHSLKCAVIPHGITDLKTDSFYSCEHLEFVSIPKSVITYSGNVHFQRCTSLKMLTIPQGPTSIPTSFVQACSSLTKFHIPSGVETIGEAVFSGCQALRKVTIPSSVTSVGKSAFYSCHSLETLVFPSAVTVGATMCAYSYGLHGVIFQNGATMTDLTNQYTSCYGIKKAYLPSNTTVIKTKCFQYCYQLEEITIPNTVTTIETYAFNNCASMLKIVVPSSVTSIESNAFSACKAAYFVFLRTTPPTLAAVNALDSTGTVPIYVPSESVNAYKTASNWSSYASRIEAIPEGLPY